MSKFAPMVKMNTTEPSVILKLKKGGKVKSKTSEDCGHKPMSSHAMGGAFESEAGQSPKRPSMAARNKAMNPNQYAKGGKVAHKAPGGPMGASLGPASTAVLPMGNPMGGMMPAGGGTPAMKPMMKPMGAQALGKMAPNARAKRAMQVRKALTGMKKGGSTDPKCCSALERELKHHESLKSDVAHHADGGSAIAPKMTKTTLKNSVVPFVSKIDTVKPDNKTNRKTGEVKQGNGGGFKCGGGTKAYAAGGTIEGNESRFENTKVNTARPFSGSKDTGGVRMSNAGGFKKGGTIEGGNWENRAANTTPKGVSGTKTGEVKKANAGGYKSGGNTSKKAYATGGNVVDDGKAVKMPKHFVSRPVANSLQSGTFKRGGKVKHHAAGGSEPFGTFEDEDSASVAKKAKPAPKSSKSKEEADRIRLRDEGMNMFDDQSAKAKGGKVDSPIKGTRKVASYGDHEHTSEVRYSPEWQEYQVHHYKLGKHLGEGPVSYHYGDKEDAHALAQKAGK
jgi:hypothetical protein